VNLTSFFNATATSGGNANSPTVVVNPYNSQDVVAVWGVDISNLSPAPQTTAIIQGQYSLDGGNTWSGLPGIGRVLSDPVTSPVVPYLQVTNFSIGFDSLNNFYVLDSQHNAANTSGTLALSKFSLTPGGLSVDYINHAAYVWVPGGDQAVSPIMAVDSGTFPGSLGGPPAGVPNDPAANNIYIAWATVAVAPADPNLINPFNPNRIQLIGSQNGGTSFTADVTANVNANFGTERDSHPQLVINHNNDGAVTIAWEDFGSLATASPPVTLLQDNIVQPGQSFSFNGQTGPIAVAGSQPDANFANPVIYNADPNNEASQPSSVAIGNLDGNNGNDIIISEGIGHIGWLLNKGTGTFPNTATILDAGARPSDIALGYFQDNTDPTGKAIKDAVVSNDSASGGGITYFANSGGSFSSLGSHVLTDHGQQHTVAVATGRFLQGGGSNSLDDYVVAVNEAGNAMSPNGSITIVDEDNVTAEGLPITLTKDMAHPVAAVVADFNQDGLPDIAVLNSTGSIKIYQNTSDATTVSFDTTLPLINLNLAPGVTSVAMASGDFNQDFLSDLVVVNSDKTVQVLQNTSKINGPTITFSAPTNVFTLAGVPVAVATGILHGGGGAQPDIAVAYARPGDSESMVAVLRNNGNFTFVRVSPPGQTGDFDAGATNPTGIAVGDLDGSLWDDIVVSNNQGRGTISVLLSKARPVGTLFGVNVNVANPAAIDHLAATLAVDEQTSLANLSATLIAPNGFSITLFTNQNNAAGQAITPNIGISGNALGIQGFTTGATGNPGIVIGTTFEDNATRDIVDLNPVNFYGLPSPPFTAGRGAASPFIGQFRPESDFINGETLDSFVKSVALADPAAFNNGTWILDIANVSPTAPTAPLTSPADLRAFSLNFTKGMSVGTSEGSIANIFGYVYPANNPIQFTALVVGGALTDTYAVTPAPSTPQGVGPGLVLAIDNTLGPYSPYGADVGGSSGRTFGRIYAAFVGYLNVINPLGIQNPRTNTDIFSVYSDDGGVTWSNPVLVNNDQGTSDGTSQANDFINGGNNQITGRTQFQPEIAVDQSTGTVVVSWRDARDDAANARLSTYVSTSIDGGNTFGPNTYANPPVQAVDAITGNINTIGPASDNESAANGQRAALFGYGNQMGLAVAAGRLFPIWAGNFYGPGDPHDSFFNTTTNAVNGYPLNIWYQPMGIAAGPRVISSTMGPVVAKTLTGSAVDLPQFIPPVFSTGTTTSVIPITGDPSLDVSSLEVTLSLVYPTDGNLTISLTAPNGMSVILYGNPNDKGANFTNTTFSDTAAQSITSGTAPYTGTFRPVQPLSHLAGIQAEGNWTLQVSGGIGPHGGILQSWSLSINGVASKPTAFDVTFDRAVDPQALINAGQATFTKGDVEVFYHDTQNGSKSIQLLVTGVTPIVPPYYVTDPTQDGVDGYRSFTVAFNPDKNSLGQPSGITNYTGTFSYVIAPDNGQNTATPTPISAPVWSINTVPVPQPVISPATDPNAKITPNLPIPTWGPGGSNSNFDLTNSFITLSGYNNQTISGLTLNVTIDDSGNGNLGDIAFALVAPNGNVSYVYYKPGDTNTTLNNVTFSDAAAQSILVASGPYDNGTFQPGAAAIPLNGFILSPSALTALNGSPVNGTYELSIYNFSQTNSGTLVSWSITVNSTAPQLKFLPGAAMDQNGDGIVDQNPLTTPFTGLTPGDAYVAPMPQPTAPFTFNANNILNPPFDLNSLPLILPGPYVVSTSVPGGTGNDNLIVNGTNGKLDVTFDRPIETSSFSAGQVLQIMGPIGSISAPQNYLSDSTLQTIPAATSTGASTLNSTLTVPTFGGTFTIKHITVQVNIAFQGDSALTAVLIAPDGTQVPLFSGVGGTGANFINTVFDDAAESPITSGKAPFTGTYSPTGKLATLNGKTVDIQNASGVWVPGVWTLRVTNSKTGTQGTLENWSLSITPVITVTPVNPANGLATTFAVAFPQQALSGTYTLTIGADPATGMFPLDQAGNPVDSSFDAGLSVLRGGSPTSPVTTVRYVSTDLPKLIPAPPIGTTQSEVTSTIIVPDNFIVQGDTTSSGISGLRVTLNATYPFDPDLALILYHYDLNGNLVGSIPLATSVGAGGNQKANFTNTTFDDNAKTPIQNGGAPFTGTFNPQLPLSRFAGMSAQGTWVLAIQNNSTTRGTGNFTSWSLSFQKPVPTSGMGVPGADNINTSFRLFNLSASDAMSGQAWTPVGPASIGAGAGVTTATGAGGSAEATTAGRSGRVSGLAIDPSDPTGNTVYAAGASGGVWKTTNFLTTNPAGPTWISLTDFGPSNAVNIGSITVFPRNANTNQTVIIAATGEGNTGTPGVGFLISTDGGATWALDDSSVNVDSSGNPLPIETSNPNLARNRTFVGDTAYQVVVDPKLSQSGGVIIYAALSGPSGGIWRSLDTGAHWTNMLPGQATSVVLDQDSGPIISPNGAPIVRGNLQVVFAGIRGVGVEMSPNQGQFWSVMSGGIGNPLILNVLNAPATNVNPAAGPTPNGAQGRIVLAVPSATGDAAEDPIYEGWVYAAVATPAGGFLGLFVTKDFGQNWTEVHIPTMPQVSQNAQAIPSNDVGLGNYAITGGGQFSPQGNYDLTLALDPTNPNIAYLGGSADGGQTALVRVDATNLWDAHALVPYSNFNNDGGTLTLSSAGPAVVESLRQAPPFFLNTVLDAIDETPYENFIRSPQAPFLANATLDVYDYSSFTNSGAGVSWIPFDPGGTDYHAVTAMIDPLTGLPRLIFGNDQGVWSILDNNGSFETQVGSSSSGVQAGSPTTQLAGVDRNGNLQITQFYYGAVQPSSIAAQIAGALFYGSAQDNGGPVSDPNILTNGNITWNGPGGDAAGVGTDQQGLGSAYQFFWPCCGGNDTDFFQYIGPGLSGTGLGFAGQASGGYVGRTFGLIQASGGLPTPDPQWPFTGGANFAVNPVNSADVVISSSVGRIFVTQNSGVTWFDVGDPPVFGTPNSFSVALAYGAPDPYAPEGVGNLGNFIYVGTQTGQIYVTQDGGGSGGSNNWINISSGLDGASVKSITTDPIRGTHDAYAVTSTGVFYIADSIPSASNPTPKWVNITNNIHTLAYSIFGQNYDPTSDKNTVTLNQALSLSSIVADWRYLIPFNPADPSSGYHPVLYVSSGSSGSTGSGVYQSLDNGASWSLFPSAAYGAVADGGDLPHVSVTDLNTSLGNIDANTGMPSLAGPYQAFVFIGTLSSGSPLVTDVSNFAGLAVGETLAGPGIPSGTTIVSVDSVGGTIGLSANATAGGSVTLAAANPKALADPDLLLATTYGRGQFAINLAPLVLGNAVTVTPTSPGTGTGGPPIVTGPITIDGQSELSGFGNTTWITVLDVTDAAHPTIIAGFNPANGVPVPSSDNSTDANGNFAISLDPYTAFASPHGLKTIEVFATDNAGSVGNKVTLTFDLNPATQLVFDPNGEPPATGTAGQNFASPSPVLVDAVDTHGGIDPFYNGPVTLALGIGTNGTFPVTVNAVNGVATFSSLVIDTAGTYTLGATSGSLSPATSTSITINPAAAAQLVWAAQPPSKITVSNVFGATLNVADQFGNLETNYTQNVSVALYLNGNADPTDLGGMTTVKANGTAAVFSNLVINAVGNPFTLVATSGSLTSVPSSAINVVAPHLVVTSQPSTGLIAGTSFPLVITAETYQNTVDTAFNGTVGLSIFSGPNNATSNLPISVAASNGVATFSAATMNPVILDTAGSYVLKASSGSLTVNTNTITVVAAGVSTLVFQQEPPAMVNARSPFGLVVGALDQFGNPTTLTGNVTVQIDANFNPSGGALGGMTTVAAANGVATFSGLTISKAGNPYKLVASTATGGYTSPDSTPINVTPAPAVSLVVTLQPPPSVMVHQTFSVSVQALDQFQQPDPDFTGSVTVSVAGATLSGTLTQSAMNGVATFSDLFMTTIGNGFVLSLSSPGLTGATSNPFNVTPAAPSQLVLISQPPASVGAGVAFGFVVSAEDQYGNLATSFNASVTAMLASGSGTLGGTTTATAKNGVAVFSALAINKAGSGYSIAVSSTGLTGVTTSKFAVTPVAASQLVISSQPPATVTAGTTFGLSVTAEDPFGNVATSFNGSVVLALAANPSTGSLGGNLTATASQGQAAFSGLYLDTAASGYTINASSSNLVSATTKPITVTPAAAASLIVTIPPPTTMSSGALFGLQISALDAYKNLATGFTGSVTIALASNPGGGSLIGGPFMVNAVAGVANFTAGITTQSAGSYTLQATSPNLTPVTTGAITVIPAPATKLAVTTQPPSTVAAGAAFGFVVAAKDQYGNVAQNFSGTVSIAVASGSGSTLGGTTTVTASKGQATFANLTLTASSSPVTLLVTSTGLTGTMTNPITVTTGLARLAFSASSVSVSETAGKVTLTVTRSGYTGAVAVNVATSGGTAKAGVNYTAINQTLNFAANQNSKTVTIAIKNVGVLKSPLTFNVVLSKPGTNASLGSPSTETVTIQNSGNGASAALVTMQHVQMETNAKNQVTGIVIDFSGSVNTSEAQSPGTYQLIEANTSGSFSGKGTKAIKINSAVYNSANRSVTLSTAAFGLSRPVRLVVFGTSPNGLQDSASRFIDGNHDGVAGGNAIAILSKSGATVQAVPAGPLAHKPQRARR
jgi:subtilisin-like proprotein convertase family protein